MIKITISTSDHAAVVRLEGRLAGQYVVEVRKSCEPFVAEDREVTIDVTGVSFVDRDGLALIRHLMGQGVHFANCSLFLAEQLKEVSS